MQSTLSKLISVCIVLTIGLVTGCKPPPAAALGTLEWDQVHGRAVVSEAIVELFAKEGDAVKRGQPILRLDTRLQDAQIDRLKANVQKAEWHLKQMQAGYRKEEIASSVAAAEAAKSSRETRQLEYDREKSLVKNEASSARKLEVAANALARAKAEERSTDETRKMMESGYRVEEVEQAKSALASAQAELQHAQERLNRYTVKAERDGLLDSLPFKLGDKPPLNAVVSTVLAGQKPWARVYLPEPWLSQVQKGDTVNVFVDGRKEPYNATVRYISSDASFTPYFTLSEEDRSRLSFVTEVDLVDADATKLPLGIPVRMKLRDRNQD